MKKDVFGKVLLLTGVLCVTVVTIPGLHSKERGYLKDVIESDAIKISDISFGNLYPGKNTLSMGVTNKTNEVQYLSVDIRVEPGQRPPEWAHIPLDYIKWQRQFYYTINPGEGKTIKAVYEMTESENTYIRLIVANPPKEYKESFENELYHKDFFAAGLIETNVLGYSTDFRILSVNVGEPNWGRNLLKIRAKNLGDRIGILRYNIQGRFESGFPGIRLIKARGSAIFLPKEEKTIERFYYVRPNHGKVDFSLEITAGIKALFSKNYEFEIPMPNRIEGPLILENGITLPGIKVQETQHFVLYYTFGSLAEKEIEKIKYEREGAFRKLEKMLEVKYPMKIIFFLFPDSTTKTSFTWHIGTAGGKPGTEYDIVFEIYNEETKADPYHELSCLFINKIGSPPAILFEGFAVFMHKERKYEGYHFDAWTKAFKELGELWPIERLFTFTELGPKETKPRVAYPEAASFVNYLINRYGIAQFRRLCAETENSDLKQVQEKNMERFEEIIGHRIKEVEKEWLTHISLLEVEKIPKEKLETH